MEKFLSLKKKIKKNEGFRNKPYLDTLGYSTIGYGHLITNKEKKMLKGKFSKKFLTELFDKDFKKALFSYKKNFNHKKHSKDIKEVLIEMIFQLGIQNVLKFRKMINSIKKNDYITASEEMFRSKWYLQTPNRVKILAKIMKKNNV